MELIISGIAFFLVLLATGASVVFIIKQERQIYKYSYRILLVGFLFLTASIIFRYMNLGAFPVLTFKHSHEKK